MNKPISLTPMHIALVPALLMTHTNLDPDYGTACHELAWREPKRSMEWQRLVLLYVDAQWRISKSAAEQKTANQSFDLKSRGGQFQKLLIFWRRMDKIYCNISSGSVVPAKATPLLIYDTETDVLIIANFFTLSVISHQPAKSKDD